MLALALSLAWPTGGVRAEKQARQGGKAESAVLEETARLRQRVEQLEEQLVDMQVLVGTLETLARTRAGAAAAPSAAPAGTGMPFNGAAALSAPPANGGGDMAARLATVETQIRALSGQIAHLTRQVQALEATGSGGVGATAGAAGAGARMEAPATGLTTAREQPGNGFRTETSPLGPAPTPPAPRGAMPPATGDPIGDLLSGNGMPESGARREVAALADGGPKALYERAYGFLLQQDYGAAENAFRTFLQRYPQDKLASNAQYWLGESYYVRGQYGKAAKAFLDGYRAHRKGIKAPDSLLKLAMSLARLGEKEQACAAFSELGRRFPAAPAHVKRRAARERSRAGC